VISTQPVHDPRTCPTCGPIIASEAYRRGLERAGRMDIPLVVDREPVR